MARETRVRRNIRYGKCTQEGCKNYRQTIAIEDEEFKCPECEGELVECPPPPTKNGKGKIIIGAVVVVALAASGIGYGILGGGNDTKAKKEEPTVVNDTIKKDSVAVDTPKVKEPVKVDPKPIKKPLNGRGTVYLDYGKYTGDLKNGKPHGYGKITYTTTTKIVNSKDFVANPGDTFEGEFRDGRISGQGYWTHDGNQTVVKP